MTLPASGSITNAMIRTEIGGSGDVVVPSAEVRTLTGIPSGSIICPDDFWGKSSSPPMSASNNGPGIVIDDALPNKITPAVTATPSGGTAPYTYAWTHLSGDNGTINSPTSAATTVTFTGMSAGQSREGIFRCTVTDSLSATATTDATFGASDIS